MGIFNGTDFKASIVTTPTNKPIADLTDLSLSINNEKIDITTKDSGGWKRILNGVRSWSGDAKGILNFTEDAGKAGIKSLLTLLVSRAELELLFGTTVTGDLSFGGKLSIDSIEFSTPVEGKCEWTMSFTGNGPLTIATLA